MANIFQSEPADIDARVKRAEKKIMRLWDEYVKGHASWNAYWQDVWEGRNLPERFNPMVNPHFRNHPGSIDKHHAYEGGLIEHTSEVIELSLLQGVVVDASGNYEVDRAVLFFAALYHDIGKLRDYERETIGPIVMYKKTPHYEMVHHVVASANIWQQAIAAHQGTNVKIGRGIAKQIEHVYHCILAHHGRLDWGSPTTPKTREAYAVHLADMASVNVIQTWKETPKFIESERKKGS